MSNIGKNVEELEHSYMAVENLKWQNHFEEKNKHTHTILSSHSTTRYLCKRNESMCPVQRLVHEYS